MAYNLMNSTPGTPLGQPGQANNSSQPPGLFSNAGPQFNNFGKGIEQFKMGLKPKLDALMQKFFPGQQGNSLDGPSQPGMPGGAPAGNMGGPNGAPSLFGTPAPGGQQGAPQVNAPGATNMPPQLPGAPNPIQAAMQPGQTPQAGGPQPMAPQGGPMAGILSRFMGGGQQ